MNCLNSHDHRRSRAHTRHHAEPACPVKFEEPANPYENSTVMMTNVMAVFGPKLPLELSANCLREHWGGLTEGNHFPDFEGEAKTCTETLAKGRPYFAAGGDELGARPDPPLRGPAALVAVTRRGQLPRRVTCGARRMLTAATRAATSGTPIRMDSRCQIGMPIVGLSVTSFWSASSQPREVLG